MSDTFKVLWPDGHESPEVSVGTVSRWLQEGLIKDTTLVYAATLNRWLPASEALQLCPEKNSPAPEPRPPVVTPIETPSVTSPDLLPPEPLTQPPVVPSSGAVPGTLVPEVDAASHGDQLDSLASESVPQIDDNEPFPTSRLGIWLYLALVLFLAGFSMAWAGGDKAVPNSDKALAIDFFFVIGLFRRKGFLRWNANTWRGLAMFRLVGTVVFVGIQVLFHPTPIRLAANVIVAVMCLGVLGTLAAPPLESWRAAAGVSCCVFGAICLVCVSQAAWPFQGLAIDAAIRAAALPQSDFVDQESGIKVHLPGDWVQLPTNSPWLPAKGAKAVFGHPGTQQFVLLFKEYVPASTLGTGRSPVDRYLDLILENRHKTDPTLIETGPRVSTQCGQWPAREARLAWSSKGSEVRGVSIAFDDGWALWQLSGFSLAGWSPRAQVALVELQRSVSATKTIDARIAEITQGIVPPVYSQRALELVGRCIFVNRLSGGGEAAKYAYDLSSRGFQLLSVSERQEFQAILARAIQTLPPAQQGQASRLERSAKEGGPKDAAAREAANQWYKLVVEACGKLPQRDRERLQRLMEKALVLATSGS